MTINEFKILEPRPLNNLMSIPTIIFLVCALVQEYFRIILQLGFCIHENIFFLVILKVKWVQFD